MKKIVIHCTTNTVGTDSWEFFNVTDSTTHDELYALAYSCALANAEMYGLYPPSDEDEEYDNDSSDDGDSTDENIEGTWEVYNSEKHDGYTQTGTPVWVDA